MSVLRTFQYPLVPMYIFTQPLDHEQDVTQGQFLSGVQLVLIQTFSSYITWDMVKEPNLLYNLSIAVEMNSWIHTFPRLLCERQTASTKIWTRIAESISYKGTRCTMSVHMYFKRMIVTCRPRKNWHLDGTLSDTTQTFRKPALISLGSNNNEKVFLHFRKLIYIYIYIAQEEDATQWKLFSGVQLFKVSVFLLQHWLSYLKNPVCPVIYPLLGNNRWMYPKGISLK